MRAIPGPRRADAPPMPEGDSRDWLRHPGAEVLPRVSSTPCHARRVTARLQAGTTLLDAVSAAVEAAVADGGADGGADGACAILDGVALAGMAYVMPDGPPDDRHAAWYSETCTARNVTLDRATAPVGRRDGAWFLHCHAMWNGGMGHLLNDRCILAADCEVTLWLTQGARLEVAPDPETGFPLFAPRAMAAVTGANAATVTVRPHEDLHAALEAACATAGLIDADLHGIGSLIGAGFHDAPPMSAPMSEVLLLPGCRLEAGRIGALPVACVDPWGTIHQGHLRRGAGPVCVTFEVLAVGR
ncbi:PPC domain-containing DNA-binding protein [Frigidibacter oleivorans]|uniref:DUF296 domain-containing protein n=1 Tax=Frigidibacter oleivorans TaxID=2487129 RepID=UPI0013DE8DD6|nr:DUF296 domain-containing protein [Frigidibacter oleivorans]